MFWSITRFLTFLGIFGLFQKTESAPHPLVFHSGYKLLPLYSPPSVRGDFVDIGFSPSGIMVLTRRGEIWEVTGEKSNLWRLFASGLRSPLGIERIQDHEYLVIQPHEVTLVADSNRQNVADSFSALSSNWPQTGPQYEWIEGPYLDSMNRIWTSYLNLTQPQPSPILYLSIPKPSTPTPHVTDLSPTSEISPPSFIFRHYERLGRRVFAYLFTAPSQGEWATFSGDHFYQDVATLEIWRGVVDSTAGSQVGSFHLFTSDFPIPIQRVKFSPEGVAILALAPTQHPDLPIHAELQWLERKREMPFEIRRVEEIPHGFRFHFTHPVRLSDTSRLTWTLNAPDDHLPPGIQNSRETKGELEANEIKRSEDGQSLEISLATITSPWIFEFNWQSLTSVQEVPLHPTTSYYRPQPSHR